MPRTARHPGTWRKFYRRLLKLLYDGGGVLRRNHQEGPPLNVTANNSCPPKVIDLSPLSGSPSLQQFVVATTFCQLVKDRTGAKK